MDNKRINAKLGSLKMAAKTAHKAMEVLQEAQEWQRKEEICWLWGRLDTQAKEKKRLESKLK